MSLIENIANNIKVLHKVKSVPTNTSKIGIHLVEGGGVYIVTKDPVNPALKVVKKIYESSDYYMKGSVDAMLSALADDDDLENTIINGVPVIREKTIKAYTPETYSGMGRIILRKNMVGGVNVLTQAMINQANTIYEIRYDFTLNEDITIPANCVLEFEGGSIKGGKITLSSGCTIDGNGAKIETANNTTIGYALQTQRNTANNIVVRNINFVGHCSYITDHETGLCAIEFVESDNVIIEGCTFTGFNKNIELTLCNNVIVTKNTIFDATETANKINGYGILLEGGSDITISNNKLYNIERHAIYVNGVSDACIFSNYISGQTNDLERYSHWEGNIKVNGVNRVQVTKNICIGNYYGIALMGAFDSNLGCNDVLIEGNIIKNCIPNSGNGFGAIGFHQSAEYNNVVICNNIIDINPENNYIRGIAIGMGTPTSEAILKNIKIHNNIVKGTQYGFYIALSPCNLSENLAVDCTVVGYMFSGNDLLVSGAYNYYENCPNGSGFVTWLSSRYCSIRGILPNKTGSHIIENGGSNYVLNAGNNDHFVFIGSTTTIADILGFNGQTITLRGNGSGTLIVNDVAGRIILTKGTFSIGTAWKDYITLINEGGVWYEIGRGNASV